MKLYRKSKCVCHHDVQEYFCWVVNFLFLLSFKAGISGLKSYSYVCIHLDLRVSLIFHIVLNIFRTDRCYTSIVGNVGESNYQSLIHDSTHMYSTISLKDLNERKPKDGKNVSLVNCKLYFVYCETTSKKGTHIAFCVELCRKCICFFLHVLIKMNKSK